MIAGSVAILVLIFGAAFVCLAPLVVLVGWSRLELGHHTPRQVIAGAGLGALVATLEFSLLR
jgi:membrane-associated phospholipid phosphatase